MRFSDSVRNCIGFGNIDQLQNTESIVEAAKLSGADKRMIKYVFAMSILGKGIIYEKNSKNFFYNYSISVGISRDYFRKQN